MKPKGTIPNPPGCTCKLKLQPHPEKPGRAIATCACGSAWNGQAVYETNLVEPVKEAPTNGST